MNNHRIMSSGVPVKTLFNMNDEIGRLRKVEAELLQSKKDQERSFNYQIDELSMDLRMKNAAVEELNKVIEKLEKQLCDQEVEFKQRIQSLEAREYKNRCQMQATIDDTREALARQIIIADQANCKLLKQRNGAVEK